MAQDFPPGADKPARSGRAGGVIDNWKLSYALPSKRDFFAYDITTMIDSL